MANCPGADKCPYSGTLILEGAFRPEPVICPRYRKWIKQIELEHEVRNAVPENFAHKSFENFLIRSADTGNALKTAKQYAQTRAWRNGANLVFVGPYGTGKTHLAIAILREAIKTGDTAAMLLAIDLLHGKFEEIDRRIEKLQAVDLLIIDDISSDFDNRYFSQRLFELLEHRYRRGKGTIFTTNLTAKDFMQAIGERLFSRIYEKLVIIMIEDINDYRKELRDKNLGWLTLQSATMQKRGE